MAKLSMMRELNYLRTILLIFYFANIYNNLCVYAQDDYPQYEKLPVPGETSSASSQEVSDDYGLGEEGAGDKGTGQKGSSQSDYSGDYGDTASVATTEKGDSSDYYDSADQGSPHSTESDDYNYLDDYDKGSTEDGLGDTDSSTGMSGAEYDDDSGSGDKSYVDVGVGKGAVNVSVGGVGAGAGINIGPVGVGVGVGSGGVDVNVGAGNGTADTADDDYYANDDQSFWPDSDQVKQNGTNQVGGGLPSDITEDYSYEDYDDFKDVAGGSGNGTGKGPVGGGGDDYPVEDPNNSVPGAGSAETNTDEYNYEDFNDIPGIGSGNLTDIPSDIADYKDPSDIKPGTDTEYEDHDDSKNIPGAGSNGTGKENSDDYGQGSDVTTDDYNYEDFNDIPGIGSGNSTEDNGIDEYPGDKTTQELGIDKPDDYYDYEDYRDITPGSKNESKPSKTIPDQSDYRDDSGGSDDNYDYGNDYKDYFGGGSNSSSASNKTDAQSGGDTNDYYDYKDDYRDKSNSSSGGTGQKGSGKGQGPDSLPPIPGDDYATDYSPIVQESDTEYGWDIPAPPPEKVTQSSDGDFDGIATKSDDYYGDGIGGVSTEDYEYGDSFDDNFGDKTNSSSAQPTESGGDYPDDDYKEPADYGGQSGGNATEEYGGGYGDYDNKYSTTKPETEYGDNLPDDSSDGQKKDSDDYDYGDDFDDYFGDKSNGSVGKGNDTDSANDDYKDDEYLDFNDIPGVTTNGSKPSKDDDYGSDYGATESSDEYDYQDSFEDNFGDKSNTSLGISTESSGDYGSEYGGDDYGTATNGSGQSGSGTGDDYDYGDDFQDYFGDTSNSTSHQPTEAGDDYDSGGDSTKDYEYGDNFDDYSGGKSNTSSSSPSPIGGDYEDDYGSDAKRNDTDSTGDDYDYEDYRDKPGTTTNGSKPTKNEEDDYGSDYGATDSGDEYDYQDDFEDYFGDKSNTSSGISTETSSDYGGDDYGTATNGSGQSGSGTVDEYDYGDDFQDYFGDTSNSTSHQPTETGDDYDSGSDSTEEYDSGGDSSEDYEYGDNFDDYFGDNSSSVEPTQADDYGGDSVVTDEYDYGDDYDHDGGQQTPGPVRPGTYPIQTTTEDVDDTTPDTEFEDYTGAIKSEEDIDNMLADIYRYGDMKRKYNNDYLSENKDFCSKRNDTYRDIVVYFKRSKYHENEVTKVFSRKMSKGFKALAEEVCKPIDPRAKQFLTAQVQLINAKWIMFKPIRQQFVDFLAEAFSETSPLSLDMLQWSVILQFVNRYLTDDCSDSFYHHYATKLTAVFPPENGGQVACSNLHQLYFKKAFDSLAKIIKPAEKCPFDAVANSSGANNWQKPMSLQLTMIKAIDNLAKNMKIGPEPTKDDDDYAPIVPDNPDEQLWPDYPSDGSSTVSNDDNLPKDDYPSDADYPNLDPTTMNPDVIPNPEEEPEAIDPGSDTSTQDNSEEPIEIPEDMPNDDYPADADYPNVEPSSEAIPGGGSDLPDPFNPEGDQTNEVDPSGDQTIPEYEPNEDQTTASWDTNPGGEEYPDIPDSEGDHNLENNTMSPDMPGGGDYPDLPDSINPEGDPSADINTIGPDDIPQDEPDPLNPDGGSNDKDNPDKTQNITPSNEQDDFPNDDYPSNADYPNVEPSSEAIPGGGSDLPDPLNPEGDQTNEVDSNGEQTIPEYEQNKDLDDGSKATVDSNQVVDDYKE